MLRNSRITMLARAAAPRRATIVALRATQRISARQIPTASLTRSVSFLPWRKKPDPSLPVYFPKLPSGSRRAPMKKLRYAIITVAVYYFLFQVYMSVVLDPLFDWAETEWESLSEKEKIEMEKEADDEDAEPLLFLPFPFTTKEVLQPPYKGSDPEWATFIKVSKDTALQKKIKESLAENVRKTIERNPAIIAFMGGSGSTIRVKKWWLDIIYPPAPPPKHYVSGLIVDWDGLFWGDRSIDGIAAHRLNAIMYPKAVAMSVWSFWRVFYQQTKEDISKALGFDSGQPETTWQSVIMDRSRGEGAPGGAAPKPNVLDPTPPPTKKTPSTPHSPLDFDGLFRKPAEGEVQMSPSMLSALQAASFTLSKYWKPPMPTATRGSIRVDGLIELQGPKAVMAVYVIGWYDPQTKTFVNVNSQVKHLVKNRQRPLGGR